MNKFLKDLADPDHVGYLTRKGGLNKLKSWKKYLGIRNAKNPLLIGVVLDFSMLG